VLLQAHRGTAAAARFFRRAYRAAMCVRLDTWRDVVGLRAAQPRPRTSGHDPAAQCPLAPRQPDRAAPAPSRRTNRISTVTLARAPDRSSATTCRAISR
jgi:hypothetical protein